MPALLWLPSWLSREERSTRVRLELTRAVGKAAPIKSGADLAVHTAGHILVHNPSDSIALLSKFQPRGDLAATSQPKMTNTSVKRLSSTLP